MKVKKLWVTPDPEFQIVRSARICYDSEDKIDSKYRVVGLKHAKDGGLSLEYPVTKVELGSNDKALLEKLVANGHGMTLRFASAAFSVEGISRACSHQLVRLAHFGILQRSQRYVSEADSGIVSPEGLEKFEKEIKDLHRESLRLYSIMLEAGVKQEAARYVLPEATETAVNLSSNFQGWHHLFDIRLQKKVMPETYEVAKELWRQLYKEAPIVFGKFKDC
jgi:thymidylate synthase (FAD)